MLLSILIPSRNRPSHIERVLSTLLEANADWDGGSIEIVISDNWSTDPVSRVVAPFQNVLPLRVVRPDGPLETAEENLFFGLSQVRGDWIWFLGDDDVPEVSALSELADRCSSNTCDAMVWNSRLIGNDGRPLRMQQVICSSESINMSIHEFMLRAGMWYVAAGFSTWVVRREFVSRDDAVAWLSRFRSPIYSHVSYLLMALRHARFEFINRPLVSYRVNSYDDGGDAHWERYAKRNNVPLRFPWTVGFVEQLAELEREGALSKRDFGLILEQTLTGARFPLYQSVGSMLLGQLHLGLVHDSQRLRHEDVELCVNWLRGAAPIHSDTWEACLSASKLAHSGTRFQRFRESTRLLGEMQAWEHLRDTFPYWTYFLYRDGNWNIFDTALGLIAVPADQPELLHVAMSGVSIPQHPLILSSESHEGLSEASKRSKYYPMAHPTDFVDFPSSVKWSRSLRASARLLPSPLKVRIRRLLGM